MLIGLAAMLPMVQRHFHLGLMLGKYEAHLT